jgi:hypothetical protein
MDPIHILVTLRELGSRRSLLSALLLNNTSLLLNTTQEHLSNHLKCGHSREHGKEIKTENVDISAKPASRKILGVAIQAVPSYSFTFMTQDPAT